MLGSLVPAEEEACSCYDGPTAPLSPPMVEQQTHSRCTTHLRFLVPVLGSLLFFWANQSWARTLSSSGPEGSSFKMKCTVHQSSLSVEPSDSRVFDRKQAVTRGNGPPSRPKWGPDRMMTRSYPFERAMFTTSWSVLFEGKPWL